MSANRACLCPRSGSAATISAVRSISRRRARSSTRRSGLLPYNPLASGLLTGKYKRGEPFPAGSRFASVKDRDYAAEFINEANWSRLERLTAFAQARGHWLIELAMSWLLANPLVACAIVGATTAEQVEENVRAAGWALTGAEMDEVDRLCTEPA
jgi:aryl-alcohol dehydrogenase-like predicted oxidoreductase